jgi:PEP-CTERM motif
MKNLITKVSSALAMAFVSFAVSAGPINGGFSIGGGATPLGGATMGTATGVSFGGPNTIASCVGDIATILGGSSCGGATGTVNAIAAGTIPGANGGAFAYLNPNWININLGGVTFSITGITSYEHGSRTLTLEGTGMMEAATGGWTATPGTFLFTAQGVQNTFSFSSSQVSSGDVPLPGSIALLGIGLAGATLARKSRAKA